MSRSNYLKRTVREIVSFFIRMSGIYLFVREMYARDKITIVLYHDPDPDILDKHLEYFSKKYHVITLDRAVNAIRSADWSAIPEKSLVITVDDGRKGNFNLLKIFKKYGIIPTIYINSQFIEDNPCIGNDILKTEKPIYRVLSCDEIAIMNNFVSFQSHSRHHPILSLCQYEECEKEIRESKSEIEIMTGHECRDFSYPSGYYTKRELNMIKKAGYTSARTIDVGWNTKNTDPYKLKIVGISDDASLNWVKAQMSGMIMYFCYLFNGSLSGKFRQIKT